MSGRRDLHGVIVGLGSIGNRHMRNLAERIGKLTVVRRKKSNAQFKPLAGVQVVHTIDQAIASQPDFAVICNPSHLHVLTASRFLASGVPCLIEKPLAHGNDAAVKQFVDTVAESAVGGKCAMAYCMRYHGAYNTARRMIASEAIGRTLYAKAWFEGFLPDWHPWEDHRSSYAAHTDTAGGALRTLDHEIDFVNWALGPPCESLGMTFNSGAIGIEADDVAMVNSRHDSGVSSQLTLSLCRKPPSRGFEIVGDVGTLRFTMESEQLVSLGVDGSVDEVGRYTGDEIDSMYIEMIDDYLKLIVGDNTSDSVASVNDGVAALQVIDSVTRSARQASDVAQ